MQVKASVSELAVDSDDDNDIIRTFHPNLSIVATERVI